MITTQKRREAPEIFRSLGKRFIGVNDLVENLKDDSEKFDLKRVRDYLQIQFKEFFQLKMKYNLKLKI